VLAYALLAAAGAFVLASLCVSSSEVSDSGPESLFSSAAQQGSLLLVAVLIFLGLLGVGTAFGLVAATFVDSCFRSVRRWRRAISAALRTARAGEARSGASDPDGRAQ
jgi:hypothetical protein